ncbi:MAG: NAD(P)/FAD-dependent oxidoreductase [Gammaproteobacteria bacterium]
MKSDLVIIGGGIIGLYSAYLLAQRGINITLIDKSDFGQESSWVAGGILAPLLPWHYSPQVLSLTTNASNDYYNLSQHLFEHTNLDIEYWKCGLTILESYSEETKQWCNKQNIVYQQNEQLPLDSIYLPDIAQVRMPLVLTALIQCLQQKSNVRLLNNTTVDSYHVHKNHMVAVNTSIGNIDTEHVLLATGAWSPKINNSKKHFRMPAISPIKGQIIAIQTIPGLLDQIIYKNGHYLIPRKDGLIIAGSTLENVGYSKNITDSARNKLWENSLSMLPELNNYSITYHWAGLRPGSPENIPTIGPHPDVKGLYLNCGHFRYGVAMAPRSAEIISQWIINNGATLNDQERRYRYDNFA